MEEHWGACSNIMEKRGRKKGHIPSNKGVTATRAARAAIRVGWLMRKGYDLITAKEKANWEFGIEN